MTDGELRDVVETDDGAIPAGEGAINRPGRLVMVGAGRDLGHRPAVEPLGRAVFST